MKEKLVPSSWLEKGGRRLDCGPYFSGAIEARATLDALSAPKKALAEVTLNREEGIFHAGREGRTWVDDPAFGIPFLSSSEILAADLTRAPLISKKQIAETPEFLIHSGWTLITRSGTVGRMVFCRPEMDGLACSEHVMRVVPDPAEILPGYLFAYLASRYGAPLVASSTYGAIIQHIEPEHLRSLPVPIAAAEFQQRVHDLIAKAAEVRTEANSLLRNVTELIHGSLGLPEIPRSLATEGVDVSVTSSRTLLRRMDSIYHSQYHQSVVTPLTALPPARRSTVKEMAKSIIEPSRFRRIALEDANYGMPFFGTAAIMRIDPEPSYLIPRKKDTEEYIVDRNTLLVPRSGQLQGIIGHVVLPYGDVLGGAVSEDAIRIRTHDDYSAGYLFLWLSSEYGRRQLKARAFGSSIPHLDVKMIGETIVGKPDSADCESFGRIGCDIARKRHEAIILEREAKTLVENWLCSGE